MNIIKRLGSAVALSIALMGAAQAAQPINTLSGGGWFGGKETGIAIRGYDPVAYFTDAKPVAGKPEYTFEWMGAKWQFASQDHLDKFKAEPAKYAPQYGGYCAYGVAKDSIVKIEPDQWTIVDGKLYLNYDADVSKKWHADQASYIKQADSKFPTLIKK